MDMRQLEIFRYVVETGSFSKAAEKLYLSQPTVSIHIQALEERMGTRLLDRMGREVVPNHAGKILYRYARRILALREQAIQDIHHFLGEVSGRFEILASTIPGEYLLPPILALFQRKYPKVNLSLRIMDSARVAQGIAERLYPLGAVGGKIERRGLEYIPFFRERLALAIRSDHPWAKRGYVEVGELLKIPLILREEGSGTKAAFEKGLKKLGMEMDQLLVVAQLGSTTAVKEGIKAGIGASVLSPQALRDEVKWGMISLLDVKGLALERDFYLVKKSRRSLSPPIEVLRRFILEHCPHQDFRRGSSR